MNEIQQEKNIKVLLQMKVGGVQHTRTQELLYFYYYQFINIIV